MKFNSVIYLGLIFIGLSACTTSKKADVKIGFLIHSTENARWASDLSFLKEKADELGAEFIMRDAKGDETTQLKQAYELLDLGIDVLIVVAANQNTAGAIVRVAHDEDVKVISYDRMIKNTELDYLISFEYEKVGELMVEYVAERVPGGNCVVLWGDPADANAVFIKKGQQRALESLSDDSKLNVIYQSYIPGWSGATAEYTMNKVIDFAEEDVDAVIASNIPLGLAACRSISSHNYKQEDVIITAMDATINFAHSLLDGGITMTVIKPIQDLAYGAIELAINVAKNKATVTSTTVYNGRVDVPAILFPPMVIDKSNFDKELINKGYFTKEEVYQR